MFVEMYGFEPALFLTAPRLAWKEALKMTKVKSDLLIDFDIVEKSGESQNHRGSISCYSSICEC